MLYVCAFVSLSMDVCVTPTLLDALQIDLDVFFIMSDADLMSIGIDAAERKHILGIIKSLDSAPM